MARRRNPTKRSAAGKPERFRAPDKKVGTDYAVWYGPDGPEGEFAVEVERVRHTMWSVYEYTYLKGYVEDFDPNAPFSRQAVQVTARDAREAAARGVEEIARHGGDEDTVESLP